MTVEKLEVFGEIVDMNKAHVYVPVLFNKGLFYH